MKNPEQLAQSIDRFRDGFWERRTSDRPPVGVINEGVFLPIRYLHREFSAPQVSPGDLSPSLCMTDYAFDMAHRTVTSDDWIPFSAPWRAVPWLEAICGCPVQYASGSLAPGHIADSSEALRSLAIPASGEWLDCLRRQTHELNATAPPDGWVSPTILRGPSDVMAALRGLVGFYCDLYDDPATVDAAAGKVNRLLLDALDMHFAVVGPKLGGYGHIFGYWAPDKTIVIQEDALGMCSPAVYRDTFMKYSQQVVDHIGSCVLFHLHSTGFAHYRDVLGIPGLAGLQLTVEANGPSLADLLNPLRDILERSRLILFIDHYYEQARDVLKKLPADGLYVILPDRFVRSDEEYRRFLAECW